MTEGPPGASKSTDGGDEAAEDDEGGVVEMGVTDVLVEEDRLLEPSKSVGARDRGERTSSPV